MVAGNVKDLLTACWRAGVKVTLGEGDALKIAPAGKLTQELRDGLRENKDRVLHALRLREVYKEVAGSIATDQLIAMDRAVGKDSDLWSRFRALDAELFKLMDAGELSLGEFRERCENLLELFQEAEGAFGRTKA